MAGPDTLAGSRWRSIHPSKHRGNGVDTREIDAASLRDRCAAVFQDFLQFQLSARENIGFGRIEALEDMEGIKEAASASGAAPVVEDLSGQYQTILGRYFEGGRELSRGQWQKLATARGLLQPSQFIILDEPTSALDPKAEAQAFRPFAEMTRDKTAILISHRLGSARIADRILVLKDGRLIEEGTHESLVSQGGE